MSVHEHTHHEKPSLLRAERRSSGNLDYALVYEEESEHLAAAGAMVIVLVPGVPGSERDFRHLSPLIVKWAPVVRIVFPGFGLLEEDVNSPSTPHDRARYLEQIADKEGWRSIMVVGHSMGGVAALAWASYDQRVHVLSLLCSVGVKRHRGMVFGSRGAKITLTLSELPLVGDLLLSSLKGFMKRTGFKGHSFHREQLKLILSHVRDLDFDRQREIIRKLADRDDLYVGMCWTLDDRVVDPVASEALYDAIHHSVAAHRFSCFRLEEGGHNPQRSLTIEIDRWLKSLYTKFLLGPESR